MVQLFADCELDRELYQLRRDGRVVKIEPKVFDVLGYLLEHRERVVSKDELLDALWPGETVTESVLPRCIAAARRAVGDDRTRQRILQTVHGRGYRFVAEVRDAAPAAASAPRPAAPAPPSGPLFVGREAALGRLDAALEAAATGRGRIALLVGEPGIGKTRTAAELAHRAEVLGARVHVGRCFEGEGAPAFWPWLQILRDAARTLGSAELEKTLGSGAAELAQLVPELRERLPELPAGDDSAGEQARFRLFDGIAGFLRRAAALQPRLVVLDDLHWADDATLRLLEFLAPELSGIPLLLLGTYRDVEVRREHPLSRLLGALARQPDCERIALQGLGADEVARFVEALAGQPPSPTLVAAVHEMTEGNPFFIHELVRLLVDQGRLAEAQDERTWSLALPQSVRDAIGRRLDGLSRDCNALLRVAAVLGREFGVKTLERVSGVAGEDLFEQLGEALDARVIVDGEAGAGRFAFSHALVRQTLYEELRTPQRIQLHRRAGEALEEAWGQRDDAPLGELAHHFLEAAPAAGIAKALDYAVRAARCAHQLLAYEESARYYALALEAAELELPPDEARCCELLLALGDEQAIAGEVPAARESFERAAALARRLDRDDLLGFAAMGHRAFGEMGNPAEPGTLALLDEALERLGDGHPVERSRLLSRLTGTPPHSLSMANREALSEEALRLAREAGDPAALKDALGARLWASLGPDHVPRRLELARELLELSDWLDDPRIALDGYESLFGAHLILGDAAAADRALEAYARLAEELRQPIYRFMSSFMRGSRAVCAGRLEQAERLFHEARERGRGRVGYSEIVFAGQMYWLHFQRGDVTSLVSVSEFFARAQHRYPGIETVIHATLALVAEAEGRLEDARREIEPLAAHGFAGIERDEHWLLTMGMLADVVYALGERRWAEQLYALLEPYAELVVLHDLLRTFAGSVHAVLGELATLLGRPEVAVAHYEAALAREQAMGAAHAALASRAGLARALALRGGPGDAQRAAALREEVEAAVRALAGEAGGRYLLRHVERGERRPPGRTGKPS